MYITKLFTVTCPLRNLQMRTNRWTDIKKIGFYSYHINTHKTHVATEVILQDRNRLACEK